MTKMAKVIFVDGFFVSPTIVTDWVSLESRLARVRGKAPTVGEAAARFAAFSVAAGRPTWLQNTPEGRSYGGTLAAMERPEFWPGGPEGNEAGVFLVNIKDNRVLTWGGIGPEPDFPEHVKRIPMEVFDPREES